MLGVGAQFLVDCDHHIVFCPVQSALRVPSGLPLAPLLHADAKWLVGGDRADFDEARDSPLEPLPLRFEAFSRRVGIAWGWGSVQFGAAVAGLDCWAGACASEQMDRRPTRPIITSVRRQGLKRLNSAAKSVSPPLPACREPLVESVSVRRLLLIQIKPSSVPPPFPR